MRKIKGGEIKINNQRYRFVALFTQGGRVYTAVHRLLAITFIPNPENKPFVNHIDGDKYNNSLDNLEWTTVEENNLHALRTGLIPVGEKTNKAKLTANQVVEMRCLYKTGNFTQHQLADMFNVRRGTVSHIVTNRSWKHLL